jgi:hypothetical protein
MINERREIYQFARLQQFLEFEFRNMSFIVEINNFKSFENENY